MVSIKDVVRSSVKVPEFDKHLKKAGGHIGRNVVEITIKMKTIIRKPLMIKINKLRLRNLDNCNHHILSNADRSASSDFHLFGPKDNSFPTTMNGRAQLRKREIIFCMLSKIQRRY